MITVKRERDRERECQRHRKRQSGRQADKERQRDRNRKLYLQIQSVNIINDDGCDGHDLRRSCGGDRHENHHHDHDGPGLAQEMVGYYRGDQT